jgi:predicted ATPase
MPPAPGPLAIRRLPGVTEAVTAYAALTAGIGVYTFPLGVLSPAGPQRPGGAAPGLADDASDYLAAIRDITTDLNKANVRGTIAATLRRINETVISVDLDSLQNPQTAIVAHQGPNDKRLTFELRQESEGFRRFYAHLLALYQTPPKQTLVFEEPENGIYPGALSLLADEFKAAPEADRGQVLLTTHSPALLDHFSDEQIRVVELADLETEIGPLAPEQRAALREKLLYAGELLTVDPARRAAP